MIRPSAFFLLLLCLTLPVRAATAVDANYIKTDDGRVIRIAGILAPPSGQSTLARLIDGQALTLGDTTPQPNGDILADLHLPDGRSIAAAMISAGAARAYPSLGDVTVLLPLEAEARNAGRGLWADKAFAIRAPETAGQLLNSYGIVSGTVLKVAQVKGRTFLNFGADWKTDFTVELDKTMAKQIDWANLANKKVQARGWVDWNYGPHILITSPGQLQIMP